VLCEKLQAPDALGVTLSEKKKRKRISFRSVNTMFTKMGICIARF
jgi:hypothetical protein